ncbi:hypothetical protein M0804_010110 [Polistes exclamans]|nr:hypothetical protein M0804_010110 [Polistes exclamans]
MKLLVKDFEGIQAELFEIIGLRQYQTSVKGLIHTCFINIMVSIAICCQMKKIQQRMKCDWDNVADKLELKILKKYAAISRLCTITITRAPPPPPPPPPAAIVVRTKRNVCWEVVLDESKSLRGRTLQASLSHVYLLASHTYTRLNVQKRRET